MLYRLYEWYLYTVALVWFSGIVDNLYFHALPRDRLLSTASLMFLPLLLFRVSLSCYQNWRKNDDATEE